MNVDSEIKTLKKVMLHRPGKELGVLNTNNMEEYLFDELPDLAIAQKEHDEFAKIFKNEGVEVVYLVDMMAEIIKDNKVKEEFLKQFLLEANCHKEETYNYFLSIENPKDFVIETMAGIDNEIMAMPNLYFTRDSFTIIGNTIALYNMHTNVRRREVIYGEYLNKYHNDFKLNNSYSRNAKYEIEGGDVLVIGKDTIIVGVSERTSFDAAKLLAQNLFEKTNIKNVITVEIPSRRACMHLDTVLTQINENQFVIYDEFYDLLKIHIINRSEIIETQDKLKEVLAKLLNNSNINFVFVHGKTEQWNDACNTLCIAPNKFVVYDINNTTNNKYIENGSTIYKLSSKELLKGRGGPHCMSMPLIRE